MYIYMYIYIYICISYIYIYIYINKLCQQVLLCNKSPVYITSQTSWAQALQ